MATFTIFQAFPEDLGEKLHNFDSDTLKLALSNTLPTASSDATWGDVSASEIASGNGYTAAGQTMTSVTWSKSGAVSTLDMADVTITASGGSIGPFQYMILYNDTATGDALIGFYTLSASTTIADGDSFTLQIDSTGVLTLTIS